MNTAFRRENERCYLTLHAKTMTTCWCGATSPHGISVTMFYWRRFSST
jgi:hypothetical protein